MTDLASGGAKVAKETLNELQQAMAEAEKATQGANPAGGEQFQNMLQAQNVNGISPEIAGVQNTSEVLRAATAAQPRVAVPAIGQGLDTPGKLSNGLQKFMTDVAGGQQKLEKIMEIAMSGRNFSANELLALQAGVYRFTQELELTSKVIEKGTSAIKQTLNTQV